MSDYSALVSNYLGGGMSYSQRPGGRILNKIEWTNLSGYRVELIQNDEVFKNRNSLRNRGTHTTSVLVHDVDPGDVTYVRKIVSDLTGLLCFASTSPVSMFGERYPHDTGNATQWSVLGAALLYRPALDINNGAAVHAFVENTWSQYRKLQNRRKLRLIFDYLAMSESPALPLEIKLATVFIAMESLKDSYARSERIPYAGGYYRKISTPPKPNILKEPRYSFKELLEEMFARVSMRKRPLKRIISLRNRIIHSGLMRGTLKSKLRIYGNCHEIIREYVFRLLGFHGQFMLYHNPNLSKTI